MTKTIRNLINENQDSHIAITSDNNEKITFEALKKHIYDISGQLAAHGISNQEIPPW